MPQQHAPNRWLVLAGAVLVQLALGAVYAWSTFAKAFQSQASALHLSKVEASLPFEVAIGTIFLGSFVGGRVQDRRGPRVVALAGVVLYGLGIVSASFAREAGQLWLLVLGYGVVAGFGLGLAYITPIAMLQKWFPDKAGLVTGIAVGGFGFGAVITSPLAQSLVAHDPAHPAASFLPLGIGYLVAGLLGALAFTNPPSGYMAPGDPAADLRVRPMAPTSDTTARTTVALSRDLTVAQALRTPQWYLLTAILTVAVAAGISLVSLAAGAASDIAGLSASSAATLVGVMGLFNGAGRIAWAAVSDRIGKMPAFVAILAVLGAALIALPRASAPAAFWVLAAFVYSCYGGAFGTMPSTAGRFFGVSHAGGIYGLMLVGWSLGGVIGPLLASTLVGSPKGYTTAFTVMGAVALAGAVLPLVTRAPQRPSTIEVPVGPHPTA